MLDGAVIAIEIFVQEDLHQINVPGVHFLVVCYGMICMVW